VRSYFIIKRHYIECILPLCYVEIGTVSLPASNRCVQVKWVDTVVTVVPVQRQPCSLSPFYAKPSSRIAATFELVVSRIYSRLLQKFNKFFDGP